MFVVQAPRERMEDTSFGASVQVLADIYADAIVEAQPSRRDCGGGLDRRGGDRDGGAHSLRIRGREVALLVAIDGAPEIAGVGLRLWNLRYWLSVAVSRRGLSAGGASKSNHREGIGPQSGACLGESRPCSTLRPEVEASIYASERVLLNRRICRARPQLLLTPASRAGAAMPRDGSQLKVT